MSPTVTGLLLLAGSAALLATGAELFAENAAGAGRRLGVTALAIGLLLAGAEPEELLTASFASASRHPGLAAGDALGANITMLTLVLGLAALLRPVPISARVRGYCAGAAAAGLAAVLALPGGVSRVEGGLLAAAYVVLVVVVWRAERRPPSFGELAETADGDGEHRRLPLLLLLAGVALMTVGGWVAVNGAERVVRGLHQSDTVVGLTLLSLATTAELFALVWAAARRGVPELAVAGVIGSAAYNATATLGVAAVVRPLPAAGLATAASAAAALPLVIVALGWRGRLGRPAGVLLVAGYAVFVSLVLRG